jgi:hypothetical protein
MGLKHKRRLTPFEMEELRKIMDSAPQGRKPTIRQLARRFGVNQPSIVKSLGGWKGNERGRPVAIKTPPVIDRMSSSPVKIEPFTTNVPEDLTNTNKQG